MQASSRDAELGFWSAVGLITVADVSMSLDNVLAVAGAAKGNVLVLVIGLAVAIVLMAVASHFIANLLVKYPWITWIGLLIILWVALDMIYEGSHEVTCKAFNFGCSEDLWQGDPAPIGALLAAIRARGRSTYIDDGVRERLRAARQDRMPPRHGSRSDEHIHNGRRSSSTARPARPASRSASGWRASPASR